MEGPPHLVALPDGWSLWRHFCLRGAGFPEAEVLRLASPASARAIDRLLELEKAAAEARRAAGERLRRARRAAPGLARAAEQALRLDVKRLLAGEEVSSRYDDREIDEALARVRAAAEEAAAARAAAHTLFDGELVAVRAALRDIAGQALFREAVTWQNRAAVATGLDALLRHPADLDTPKTRIRERMIGLYLQRYCAKADGIGFFGPTCWGTLAPSGEAVRLQPGERLLAERTVCFEYWAIDALAETLAGLPGMRPWLLPRRMPTARLDALPPPSARVLAACSGERTARAIARELAADPSTGLAGEDEVLQCLARLVEQGLATWTLEVPVGDLHPERGLRRLLEAVGDPSLREPALAMLGELEAGRDAAARAAGDAAALARALDEADQTFVRLTARDATRRGGRTYAGRTILYEECRRDVTLEIGPELIRELAAPLVLLLHSARWYTHAVVTRFQEHFAAVYESLRQESGADEVDFLRFLERAEAETLAGNLFAAGKGSFVAEIEKELQARWAGILQLSPGERRQSRSAAALGEAVRSAFAAPHPGAPLCRYHSPDILIAADGVEAIRRGDYYFVVGELHAGMHTYCSPLDLEFCPAPDEVLAGRAVDLPYVEVFPIFTRDRYLRVSLRTYHRDVHFETGDARSWLPRERVFAAADLVLRRIDGQLMMCSRTDPRRFDLPTFLDFYVARNLTSGSWWIPPAPHTPRVTIDRLVITRESWRFAAGDHPFARDVHGFERFVAARRWAAEHGMPRFVFVKVPEEKKPFQVDFESSVSIERLAHFTRAAGSVTVTEMLPEVGKSWLADAAGNRYVSELRLAAVDPLYPPQRVSGVE